jgi:hypothetical protein
LRRRLLLAGCGKRLRRGLSVLARLGRGKRVGEHQFHRERLQEAPNFDDKPHAAVHRCPVLALARGWGWMRGVASVLASRSAGLRQRAARHSRFSISVHLEFDSAGKSGFGDTKPSAAVSWR